MRNKRKQKKIFTENVIPVLRTLGDLKGPISGKLIYKNHFLSVKYSHNFIYVLKNVKLYLYLESVFSNWWFCVGDT